MGWKSVLGGIGAGIGGFFLGGPATAIGLGSSAYQALNAHEAEGKGAQQQQAGYQQAINAYQPYNARGNAAGDTLAGYLGINVPEGGFGAPMAGGGGGAPVDPTTQGLGKAFGAMSAGAAARSAASQPEANTLATLLARYQPESDVPGLRAMSRPQTPSASRSSYRAEAN